MGVKRCPGLDANERLIEIRRCFTEDFADFLTPELNGKRLGLPRRRI